jgi:hypothetical protein
MARKVVTTLTDDIDGSEAKETITFSWKGYAYEIDLSSRNVAKFDKAILPFVDAARRIGRAGSGKASSGRTRSAAGRAGHDSAAVRAWALENGYDVTARGRIANEVRAAYEAANA